MTDQEIIDRIEALTQEQVAELADVLLDYVDAMPGGDKENDIEAKLLIKTMLSILSWKK